MKTIEELKTALEKCSDHEDVADLLRAEVFPDNSETGDVNGNATNFFVELPCGRFDVCVMDD